MADIKDLNEFKEEKTFILYDRANEREEIINQIKIIWGLLNEIIQLLEKHLVKSFKLEELKLHNEISTHVNQVLAHQDNIQCSIKRNIYPSENPYSYRKYIIYKHTDHNFIKNLNPLMN
ncbi:hypothetical protein [Legionella gresilensis]|uniref:hypothetical protein n=1 Tax=Legionella gresilensis TaxID=91823 RepID=UPI00104132F0|nr:hypothetical protein [Legionella gresilensis]